MNSTHDEPDGSGGAASKALDARLRERVLLDRAVPGDRLMLGDETILAALDGSRMLTPNERQALSASPLTLRRFRQLSLQRRAVNAVAVQASAPASSSARLSSGPPLRAAANDAVWTGSVGMLRAASSAAPLASMVTDDGFWTLHFVAQGGGWQVILALSPQAPFARRLLNEKPGLRVLDGAGGIVLEGSLDADGEHEGSWPFSTSPATHFQTHGATFAVQPAAPLVPPSLAP